jgi:hypothetical protein
MGHVMARYTVRPDQVETNAALVRDVYAELQRVQPSGFRYATFLLDDGLTFVHLASTSTSKDVDPLPKVAAFEAFQRDIAERCEVPPVVQRAEEVGSYRPIRDERNA